MLERTEQPFPGHFIGADRCEWYRTTDVGNYRISSVGEMRAEPGRERFYVLHEDFDCIGYERLYETMVFSLAPDVAPCQCGCGESFRFITNFSELMFRGAMTRDDAEANHEDLVLQIQNGHAPTHTDYEDE